MLKMGSLPAPATASSTASPTTASQQPGSPTKQTPRSRSYISSALFFTTVFICLLIPSPITLSASPSSILSSVQSLNPLRHLKGSPSSPSSSSSSSSSSASSTLSVDQQRLTDNATANTTTTTTSTATTATAATATATDTSSSSGPSTSGKSLPEPPAMLPSRETEGGSDAKAVDDDDDNDDSDSDRPVGLPRCGHILLFTAPRHGSTWFLNCVERCAFSDTWGGGTFGKLNYVSELWNSGQKGPVLSMSVSDAVQYLATNMSLKIFPVPLRVYPDDVWRIVNESYPATPLVLLTRKLDDASRSLATAKQNGVWNANTQNRQSTDSNSADDDETKDDVEINAQDDRIFKSLVRIHYKTVRSTLDRFGYQFDEVDYDDLLPRKYFVLPKNQCYIKSCNFRR